MKPLLGYTSYVIITSLRVEGQPQETKPLPLGLHILHAYTHLKNSSRRVSLVVRNVSDSHIFLKKGMLVVQVVSASLVPPMELSPGDGSHSGCGIPTPNPCLWQQGRKKLLEKLNLDRLAHWSPENASSVSL